jgi:GTP-binding protein
LAAELFKQATAKIPTPLLNKAIDQIAAQRVGGSKGAFPKMYYATQVATGPVTLLLFVNRPQLFDDNFQRFACNKLRELLGIEEVPIRLLLRARR